MCRSIQSTKDIISISILDRDRACRWPLKHNSNIVITSLGLQQRVKWTGRKKCQCRNNPTIRALVFLLCSTINELDKHVGDFWGVIKGMRLRVANELTSKALKLRHGNGSQKFHLTPNNVKIQCLRYFH